MRTSIPLLLLVLAACADKASDGDDTDVVDSETADTDVTVAGPCDDLSTAPVGTICNVIGEVGIAQLTAEGATVADTRLYLPVDMITDPEGRLVFIDWNNHRIRRVDHDGTVRTLVGTGFLGDGPEGQATLAALNHPTGMLYDPADPNKLIVAAWHNSRIETVDVVSGNLSFDCGTGARSWGGDGGDAKLAKIDLPSSIAFDDDGTLILVDSANQVLRRIDHDGIITTIAGTVPSGFNTDGSTIRSIGWTGDDGPALSARFNFGFAQKAYPAGRIAKHGRQLYVADSYNHVVRRIDLDAGTVHHVAGTGCPTSPNFSGCANAGFAGDGGQASTALLNFPTDVEVDANGVLYIADTENSCIRKVDTDGTITTFAGVCNEPGAGGDGGPATEAHLFNPYGIALGDGVLYIADTANDVIRAVKL